MKINFDSVKHLIGMSYEFEDGNKIIVAQIKQRDDGLWVTFNVKNGPGILRRTVMPVYEFLNHYGHLFKTDTNTSM